MVRREKLNWVYLTTFWQVYTQDWTNSFFVHKMYLNTANSTWFEQNKNNFDLKMSFFI